VPTQQCAVKYKGNGGPRNSGPHDTERGDMHALLVPLALVAVCEGGHGGDPQRATWTRRRVP
jgi:hypothetical protein